MSMYGGWGGKERPHRQQTVKTRMVHGYKILRILTTQWMVIIDGTTYIALEKSKQKWIVKREFGTLFDFEAKTVEAVVEKLIAHLKPVAPKVAMSSLDLTMVSSPKPTNQKKGK